MSRTVIVSNMKGTSQRSDDAPQSFFVYPRCLYSRVTFLLPLSPLFSKIEIVSFLTTLMFPVLNSFQFVETEITFIKIHYSRLKETFCSVLEQTYLLALPHAHSY